MSTEKVGSGCDELRGELLSSTARAKDEERARIVRVIRNIYSPSLSWLADAIEKDEWHGGMTETGAQLLFISGFRFLQLSAYQNNTKKGWWDTPLQDKARQLLSISADPRIQEFLSEVANAPDFNHGEKIALMHSELSEALEGLRGKNPPDDKIPNFSSVEAELADVIIRIMDYAERNRFDVAAATVAKIEMNKTRAHKHGGKQF